MSETKNPSTESDDIRIQIGCGRDFSRREIQHMLDSGYLPNDIFWDPDEKRFYHKSDGVRGELTWLQLSLSLGAIAIIIGAVMFIRELLR